jgi:surface carbohydrate biosynthesis protein
MFKIFIKFCQSFNKFVLAEKKWCWPKKCEVLILDATRPGDVLMEYFKPWSPEMLHIRGELLYIPVLLASLFKGENISNAYIDCFIKKASPRLVVTFMDHYVHFYTLSKKHPKVKTLFIQNGLKCYYFDLFEVLDGFEADATSNFFVDYMMVFGSIAEKKYSQYIAGKTVAMGSVKNNLVRKEKTTQRGVIALVSQWRIDEGLEAKDNFFPTKEFWENPDGFVIQCLDQYARTKNKRLMIIPNRLKNSSEDLYKREEEYFTKLLGSKPEFLCSSGEYPAYQAVDSAEIVVALDSTLGLESIARGNKTAIFSIRGHFVGDPSRAFGWPGKFEDEGCFWTNNPNVDSFARILDYLFEVDEEQWQKDIQAVDFSSVLSYDPGNSILKETIEQILGAPPSPWI